MIVKHGEGCTEYGPGVSIELTGDEVATAIDAWLVAHDVHVSGPRTVTVNGGLCKAGRVYVDPSGYVIADGEKLSGRGGGEPQGKAMTAREKHRVLVDIGNEGMHYAFEDYDDYKDIADPKFHELRLAYLAAAKKLLNYLEAK